MVAKHRRRRPGAHFQICTESAAIRIALEGYADRLERMGVEASSAPDRESQLTRGPNLASAQDGDHGSILVLAVLALIVGAVSGFVGALFLLLLERGDRLRDALIVWV
jgi:hypothetical protein